MGAAVFVDKSMLSGVADLSTILNADTNVGAAQRAIARITRGVFPYQGLMAGLQEVMDANEKEAVSFLEQIRKRDILFRANIPNKYDIFSKDRSGTPYVAPPDNPFLRIFNAISPVAIVDAGDDSVKQAMVDINYNLPDAMTTYKGERLTSKERSEMQKIMSMDTDLRANLERIVNSKDWQKMVEDYKERGFLKRNGDGVEGQMFYAMVHKEITRAKKRAIRQLLNQDQFADLNQRISIREAKKKAAKTGNYDRIDYLINEFPN